jgi:hypothetical protein
MNPHGLTYSQVVEIVRVNQESLVSKFAALAMYLLTDDEGISDKSWSQLLAMSRKLDMELAEKLAKSVEATDGRWYLPESKVSGVF